MTQDEVKNNLLAPAQWLRILIMAGFLLAAWVVSLVLVVIMITQAVTVLIAGEPNQNLRRFGLVTSAYMHQIIDFLVYATDVRPFPFTPFPEADAVIIDADFATPGSRQADASATTTTAPVDADVEVVQESDEVVDEPEPYPYGNPDSDPNGQNKG